MIFYFLFGSGQYNTILATNVICLPLFRARGLALEVRAALLPKIDSKYP